MKAKKVLFTSLLASVICCSFMLGGTNINAKQMVSNPEALTSEECVLELGGTVIICLGDDKNTCHEVYNNINVYCDGVKVMPDYED